MAVGRDGEARSIWLRLNAPWTGTKTGRRGRECTQLEGMVTINDSAKPASMLPNSLPSGTPVWSTFRRYVSAVYLGASRAERTLAVFSSLQRGGHSRVLQPAIDKHLLIVQPRA